TAHLELRKRDEPKLGGIFVDFAGGAMAHRRKFGGGRGEAVAKAVGIKGDYLPDVVDATAGLGRDAFVLASVGCRVRMLERNPVVAALLDDGLARAEAKKLKVSIVSELIYPPKADRAVAFEIADPL
ncbi:class I SAM-dependent methyltransferase, partial [Citrobacter freundii]|uniref:class I SAM-dependent methyltransferase n=1 Tax=Citrobacter freundii TaxID=546 RepID=UPI001F498E6E